MDNNRLKQAQQHQRDGEWAQALEIYRQLLDDHPDHADLLHQIGILLAQQQHYDEALEYLNQALRRQPHAAAFHNSKGNVLLRQNNVEGALKEYRQAIKSDPHYAIAHNNIGRCLYGQEKFIAAQKAYAQAIALNPKFGDAYYNQGVLQLKLGDLSAAKDSLEKALAFNPKNPVIYGQMSQIYLQQGDYAQAIEALQKRLMLQPQHADSWDYLGAAYLADNQPEEAVHCFEKVLQITHQHPECYEHLAAAYLKLDDKEKALTYFLRQLEIQPTVNAYYNIGALLIEKNRHREAVSYLKQAVALDPLHLPAHLNLGVLYLKWQDNVEARHHYQQAAQIKPGDPEIQHILMALTQNKTPDKAPAEYLKNLFDQYASYYDKHLSEGLRYRVPQQLHAAIYEETHAEQPEWTILDLGCGTGLCGVLFKEFAAKLIGVDISQEMVSIAEKKNIYDELVVEDVEKALDRYHDIDLILAADVFTYIGDLNLIFEKAKRVLKPGGLFAFSVEKTEKTPFELQASVRYAHSRAYLEQLIQTYAFAPLRFQEIILRTQKEQPVYGYMVIIHA